MKKFAHLPLISFLCMGIGVLVALLVTYACFADPLVLQAQTDLVRMTFSTAIALLLAAASLFLLPLQPRAALYPAGAIALLGIAILIQDLLGNHHGIEDAITAFLLQGPLDQTRYMAANTAGALALTGIAIFLCVVEVLPAKQQILLGAVLSAIVAAQGTAPILGDLAKIPVVSGWSELTYMSAPAAMCFVFLGIALMAYLRQKSETLFWLPVALFIGFTVLTISLYTAVRNQENLRIEGLIHAEADHTTERLNRGMSAIYRSFDRMANRWSAADGTPVDQWEQDANNFLKDFKALAAVSFSDADWRLVDSLPKNPNSAYIGFKLDSEPMRAEVIKRVVETNHAQNSHVLRLKSGQLGFLYINPLFHGSQISGLLLAVTDTDKLFKEIYGTEDLTNFALNISENGTHVYSSHPNEMTESRWRQVIQEPANGMIWQITVEPTEEFLTANRSYISIAVLFVGLVTTFLISLCASLAIRWRTQTLLVQKSEATFRAAMEYASIGMALVSPRGQWLRVNRALCHMLGYTADELLEMNFQNITYPEDLESSIRNLHHILSGKTDSYEAEKRYIRRDGTIIWALLTVSVVRNPDETPNYLIAQIHDISERKAADKVKEEFVSVVSHELRTPLTSIRGSLGLISGTMADQLPPQVSRLIAIAHKNSERLILLINDILDMDKIAAGKMRFNMKRESVNWLLEQAVDSNRDYALKLGITLNLKSVANSLMIQVDIDRFVQALSNLLSNAAKFSQAGMAVDISAEASGGKVRIGIHDSGSGIPLEFQTRVFGKFQQADSSVRREKDGTGLGLHITREIVTHMGGAISFESTPGVGTTFWLEFPDVAETSASELKDLNMGVVRNHVLICEDDPDVAEILSIQMRKADFTADIAYSIAEARACLAAKTYTAITLDILFPQENGLDFIGELRGNPATAALPVVVISARAEDGRYRLNGDAVGVVDWLTKPINESHLTRALKRAVHVNGHLPKVIHIEDDLDLSRVLGTALGDRASLINASTLREARKWLREEQFELIVIDIGLPDGNGLTLLTNLNEYTLVPAPVLILSASETPNDVRARVAGAMVKSTMSETKVVETILSLVRSTPRARSDGHG